MATPLYKNPKKPIAARVEDLLGRMTTEEKVGQMLQLPGFSDLSQQVREKCLGSILCVVDEDTAKYQEISLNETRLGIPLIFGIDAIHGHSMEYNATMFPSQLALACSWNEGLMQAVARATAVEMAYTGCQWTFSPVFCLPRDLRWGRVDETFGEDPVLIGRFGAAMVRGYQGDNLSDETSVAACAKHYAGYGDTVGGREASESDHTPRKMRAIFLPPFQKAVEAGCATFMTAYQVIDGTPCTANRWLLTDILRGEWNSDACVVTDWDNVSRMVNEQRVSPDLADASVRALHAGNDMIMTTEGFYRAALDGLAAGRIPMAEIDQAVRRVLTLKFKLGLFENPRMFDKQKAASVIGCAAHRELALQAARESTVLLKNNGVLPLNPKRVKTIAVIGPNADSDLEQLGDWSLGAGQGQGRMQKHDRAKTVTLLDGIVEHFGDTFEITYADGCSVRAPDAHKIQHAVDIARAADVVILALGDQLAFTGECKSTATLELMGGQKELFDALVETGTPLVVTFISSKPLAIPHVAQHADAILCAFNPGMEGGTALAEIISGAVNPSGKLTLSFPHHVGQQPCYYNQTPGAHHAGYPDLPGTTFEGLFPFGFGLSYTTFKQLNAKLAKTALKKGDALTLTVDIRNTGERDGLHILQVYLRDKVTSVTWPTKNLVDFRRVPLKSGEEKTITIKIPFEALAIVNADGQRVVEPGEFELLVGASSRDGDLARLAFSVC